MTSMLKTIAGLIVSFLIGTTAQATEKIGPAGFLSNPAIRRNIGAVSLKIKPIAARRHCAITFEALFRRSAPEMQI